MNNMKNYCETTGELFNDMRLCLQTEQKNIHRKAKQEPSTELLELFKSLNHMLNICEELQEEVNYVIAEYNQARRSYGELNLLRIVNETTKDEKIAELTAIVNAHKEGLSYKEAVLRLFENESHDTEAEEDHEAILRGIEREEK